MTKIEYTQRVVAFIDILGFKNLIKPQEKLQGIYDTFLILTSQHHGVWALENALKNPKSSHLPIIPQGTAKLSVFSDNFLLSVPENNAQAILSLLIIVSGLQNSLLNSSGIACRGAIHCGELIHGESPYGGNIIFGPAVIHAYELEQSVASYPRVVLSDAFIKTLKNLELFSICLEKHLIKRDGDGLFFVNYGLMSFGIGCDPENGIHDFELMFEAHSWVKDVVSKKLEELEQLSQAGTETYANIRSKWMWLANRFNTDLAELSLSNSPKLKGVDLNPISLPI